MEPYEGLAFQFVTCREVSHLDSLVNWRLFFQEVQVGPGTLRFLFSKGLGCCWHKTTLPIRCQALLCLSCLHKPCSLDLSLKGLSLTLDQHSVLLVCSCWRAVSTALKHSLQRGGELLETLGTGKRSHVCECGDLQDSRRLIP